ncbi:MAG: hypothetical protein J2P33_11810, partial [Actinobacteria bacterium]|nr:hypothetical protein [Actinomycetota bacterium]
MSVAREAGGEANRPAPRVAREAGGEVNRPAPRVARAASDANRPALSSPSGTQAVDRAARLLTEVV